MIHQIVFLVVAEDDRYARDASNLVGGILGEAANDGNDGIGIRSYCLTDSVAAFFFSYGCDGAGIDDIKVGFVAEIYLFPSFGHKLADEV